MFSMLGLKREDFVKAKKAPFYAPTTTILHFNLSQIRARMFIESKYHRIRSI